MIIYFRNAEKQQQQKEKKVKKNIHSEDERALTHTHIDTDTLTRHRAKWWILLTDGVDISYKRSTFRRENWTKKKITTLYFWKRNELNGKTKLTATPTNMPRTYTLAHTQRCAHREKYNVMDVRERRKKKKWIKRKEEETATANGNNNKHHKICAPIHWHRTRRAREKSKTSLRWKLCNIRSHWHARRTPLRAPIPTWRPWCRSSSSRLD